MRQISSRIKIVFAVLIGFMLFVLAAFTLYEVYFDSSKPNFFKGDLSPSYGTDTIIPTATVQTNLREANTIAYEPKRNANDSDIEIKQTQKPIVVSVNGKQHEVPTTTVKEDHKLDKGKLVITEEKQVKIDVVVPEQPRFKKGIYIENDMTNDKNLKVGGRLSYQTKALDVDLKADVYQTKRNNNHNQVTLTATKWL